MKKNIFLQKLQQTLYKLLSAKIISKRCLKLISKDILLKFWSLNIWIRLSSECNYNSIHLYGKSAKTFLWLSCAMWKVSSGSVSAHCWKHKVLRKAGRTSVEINALFQSHSVHEIWTLQILVKGQSVNIIFMRARFSRIYDI